MSLFPLLDTKGFFYVTIDVFITFKIKYPITCNHPSDEDPHMFIEKTPSNQGHTLNFFTTQTRTHQRNALPTGDSPCTHQPGSLVYILLYAVWVNRGPTRNRGRPRLAVCPQLDSILSCVRPH